jgi:ABC-type bacteriocin/lantibiotic exporter with double-glycine peptidase domain
MRWHKQRTEVARMTSTMAVDLASGRASNSAIIALLDTAAIIGSVLGALIASAWIALAIVGFLLLRALVDLRVVRSMVRLSGLVVDQSALDPTTELLRGVMQLRSAGALARGYARWARYQATSTQLRVRLGRVGTLQSVLGVLWPTLGLALILTVVALTSDDSADGEAIGVLVTAQTALTSANTALAAAIGSIGALLSARAVLRRCEPILSELPESAGGGEVAPLSGGIDVRGVSYRYRPESPPIFDGLNLSVRPGEHLALVGPSGSGKTTLLRLLLGLEDPDSGLVAYDGRDLAGLDRSGVRRQLGVVMQSSALLPGTVRDNVDMGRGLSASRVWEALELAAVADDVRAMPMGLSSVVIDGSAGISGGQRQRILLARALAGSPRILILDEATSALDNLNQRAVTTNLDRLNVTRIVVAHRLSTIENADRIAVIADGHIVAHGTYAELLSRPGPFRDLVHRQQVDTEAT